MLTAGYQGLFQALIMNEILYRKQGRKYVPVYNVVNSYDKDLMKVGTWRMVYAYNNGARRYEYDVQPDTASFRAACMLAEQAMLKRIDEAVACVPSGHQPKQYTKKQLDLLEKFRQDMREAGGFVPDWWQYCSASDLVKAGIDAMLEHEALKVNK